MCGISGAYWNDAVEGPDIRLFEKANAALRHRGPDFTATWAGRGIMLGHNRLSIIDTSAAANQPFFSADNRYAMVFNGEIFNYRQLAQELRQRGIMLRTSSDTEVLLYLLIHHGIDALQKVKGFFAFGFYDLEQHSLLLARDRFGEKPLFYSVQEENSVFFGSEMKAILPLLRKKETDQNALRLLLELTYIPAPFTILKQVRKLEPGAYLKIQPSGITTGVYYRLPAGTETIHDNENLILRGLRSHVQQAVESRMVADVPVAGFLSGGIDSSIVSALAKQLNPAYETFSLGFSGEGMFDETADARFAAAQFGIRHHAIQVSQKQLIGNVEEMLEQADEPFGDASAIALYTLCKAVKGTYRVVLSGDGADEVFAGYNKHYALYRASQNSLYNRLVKHGGWAHHLVPKSRASRLGNKARQLQKMRGLLRAKGFDRYWHLATFNHGWANRLLLQKGSDRHFRETLATAWSDTDFNAILRLDVQLVLPGDMLYKVDMASMLNAVEIRSPFLDHTLIEYAFSIPGRYKIRQGEKKYLLKKAFADVLPEKLVRKPKHGFEVPLQAWLNGPLKHLCDQYLSQAFIGNQQVFDPVAVKQLLQKLASSNPGDSPALVWTLLNFQKTWINHQYA